MIGVMVYSFARIGAALGMTVEDVYTQNRRLWVRLREKGGKRHAMPCHHNLEEYLAAYLDGAGLRDDPKGPLFRTIGRDAATGERLRDDPSARCGGPRSKPSSAITASGRPGSPRISRMAAHWKRPRRWRTTPQRVRRSSTTAAAMKS